MHFKSLSMAALIVALVPSAGHAAGCPANAFKASTAIWRFGQIQTGQIKTARHPCGRMITCTGGKFGPPKVLRECHWS